MGEVVGAAILAHVPTIMLPEATRFDLNEGKEISLVPGMKRFRKEVMETLDYDTVVVLDSHWATTVEFVVTSAAERSGLFTSEELPRGMSQIPYAMKGDPELANAIAKYDEKNGTWVTPIADPHLPIFYATVNLWHYLGRGLDDKRWISMSVCQTGDYEDFKRAGRALGEAIRDSDRKVLLLASGALSHTFWPLRELRKHVSWYMRGFPVGSDLRVSMALVSTLSELDDLLLKLKQSQATLADQHGRYVPIALKIAPDLDGDQVSSHPQHPYTKRLMMAAPVPNPVEQKERREARRDRRLWRA